MGRFLSSAVLALALTLSAPAATRPPEFSAARIKAHVTFLSDDLLEGREAGTRGHEIAARYIADEFAQMGVAPAGTDGTYFESVGLSESSTEQASLSVTAGEVSRTFAYRDRVFVKGPAAGGTVDVTAPLVYVGYGISDPALGIDDYKGLDVNGKIVVALWGVPKTIDSEIAAHLQSVAPHVAADHGAAALITISTTIPWPLIQQFAAQPSTTWIDAQGHPFDERGLKAVALIDPDAAPDLFRAAPRSFEDIRKTVDSGNPPPQGFELNATATLHASTTTRTFSSPEVIGKIEGADPRLKNEYVALMAHADHIGISPDGKGDRINNGALDNAAGVAMLLEVGRAFATTSLRPRRSILLIANTAEEKGLLGAEYFAHNPTVPIDHVSAAIDLDMPLLLYDFTDVVAYGATHSTVDQAFGDAARLMGVKLSPDPMPEQAIFVRSDHYAMVKAGVPAVMLATGMANGGKRAWDDYLAHHYHQPSDDISQPIVWKAGAKFAELNYRAVRLLANRTLPARWYAGDYFGNLFAPNATKVPRPKQ